MNTEDKLINIFMTVSNIYSDFQTCTSIYKNNFDVSPFSCTGHLCCAPQHCRVIMLTLFWHSLVNVFMNTEYFEQVFKYQYKYTLRLFCKYSNMNLNTSVPVFICFQIRILNMNTPGLVRMFQNCGKYLGRQIDRIQQQHNDSKKLLYCATTEHWAFGQYM